MGGNTKFARISETPFFFQIAIYLCNKHQTGIKLCTVGMNLKKFSKTTYPPFYSSFSVFMRTSSCVCFKNTKTLSSQ